MRSIANDAKDDEDEEDMAQGLEVITGHVMDINGWTNKITDESDAIFVPYLNMTLWVILFLHLVTLPLIICLSSHVMESSRYRDASF